MYIPGLSGTSPLTQVTLGDGAHFDEGPCEQGATESRNTTTRAMAFGTSKVHEVYSQPWWWEHFHRPAAAACRSATGYDR